MKNVLDKVSPGKMDEWLNGMESLFKAINNLHEAGIDNKTIGEYIEAYSSKKDTNYDYTYFGS